MIKLVISGGQSGADQAGLRAAVKAGIETAGTVCRGWKTEDGPRPDLAELGMIECDIHGYPARTAINVHDSDGTIIFGNPSGAGTLLTIKLCNKMDKPYLLVEQGVTRPSMVHAWIDTHSIRTLNVAGTRESKMPGIGDMVERFLTRVFLAGR